MRKSIWIILTVAVLMTAGFASLGFKHSGKSYLIVSLHTRYSPGQEPQLELLELLWLKGSGEWKEMDIFARDPRATVFTRTPDRNFTRYTGREAFNPASPSDSEFRRRNFLATHRDLVRQDEVLGYSTFVLSSQSAKYRSEAHYSPVFGDVTLKSIVIEGDKQSVTEAVSIEELQVLPDEIGAALPVSLDALSNRADQEEQAGRTTYASQIRDMLPKWRALRN